MTPQERQLIDELFDRLATLERNPRDPEAVRAINEGLDRAPHGLYPLVQTVLVQDEALRRADERIRELESRLGMDSGARDREEGSFLDNMRDSLFGGRRQSQGSVPLVRGGLGGWNSRQRQMQEEPMGGPWRGAQPGGAGAGSFLGTAAAAAAGVVGGSLLANSLSGMFGGEKGQGQAQAAQGQSGADSAPWGQGSDGGGDLSRQAGLEDIGQGGRGGGDQASERQGLFDTADHQGDEGDFGDDFDLGDSEI
ncbi:MAG: uncharacterized protein QOD74_725 [Variibacter sp.]|jgi:hypothetical protein|nr:uncharacterized protein [Variibacter sp.]